MYIWHVMADGCSSGTFLNTWSDVCRGHKIDDDSTKSSFVLDAASIFPPNTSRGYPLPPYLYVNGSPMILWEVEELSCCKSAMRRFVFDGDKLSQLRDKLTAEETGRPSRLEAMSVFLWSKFISAVKETNKQVKLNLFTNSINLRRRLDPPLPDNANGGARTRTRTRVKRATTLCYNGFGNR